MSVYRIPWRRQAQQRRAWVGTVLGGGAVGVTAVSGSVGLVTEPIPENTILPAISGSPVLGQTLTASTGTWLHMGGFSPFYTYQWQRDNAGDGVYADIAGQTTATHVVVSADLGDNVRCLVTAHNSGGTATAASVPVAAGETVPVNTVAPGITGTPAVGSPLAATNGSWTQMGGAGSTFTYQWQRNTGSYPGPGVYPGPDYYPGFGRWEDIAGATGSSYTPVAGDSGHYIQVVVTAHNTAGTAAAASNTVGAIDSAPVPISIGAPIVTGTAVVGQTLTTTTGVWSNAPTSYAYQWERDSHGDGVFAPIGGATAATYSVVDADDGCQVRVKVTAHNAAGDSTPAASNALTVAEPAPAVTVPPAISGTAEVGSTLSVTDGTWLHMGGYQPAFGYQWYRDGHGDGNYTPIAGATANTYLVVDEDDGCEVTAEATAQNTGGFASSTAAAVGPAVEPIPVNVVAPTIAPSSPAGGNAPTVGFRLNIDPGVWLHMGGYQPSYTYQWESSPDGITWAAIPGATAGFYTPRDSDAGLYLHVLVTAHNTGGVSDPATSNSLGPLPPLAPLVTQAVAKAVHEVKVSWDKQVGNTGWFTLNVSLLNSADKLAPASQIIPSFSGDYDDMSAYLVEAGWSYGRSATLEQVEQGKWRATFRDPDGRFNPQNPASVLYGYVDKPSRPLRHLAKLPGGQWEEQFYGWIRTLEYEPVGRRGYLHIEADDLFVKLDVPAPTIAPRATTTTGGVIGACLDAIGFTDPAYRDLDVGDAITGWAGISDASATLLQLIAEVLQIEFGLFFANGNGTAIYESRNQRMLRPVDYVLSQEMRAFAPGASLDGIVNTATFTKTDGTPQTYTDAASADPIFGFGPRAAPSVESPYLASDEAALARAQYVVNTKKDPVGEVWALKLDNRTDDLLQAVLAMAISNRVQADEASTGGNFDGFVERIERSVSTRPYSDTINCLLSQRPSHELFIISRSLVGGSDVLAL